MSKNALKRLKEDASNYYNKEKCEYLKKIRKAIAYELGIDLHQTDCTYEGDCSGTCPKCEQEEKILNNALSKKGISINFNNSNDEESNIKFPEMSERIDFLKNNDLVIDLPEPKNGKFVRTGDFKPVVDDRGKYLDNIKNNDLNTESEEEFMLTGYILP